MEDAVYADAAHLLRRAGFGPTPSEITQAVKMGLPAATDALLHPQAVPDTVDYDVLLTRLSALTNNMNRQGREFVPLQVAKMWWAYRMTVTPRPLEEKMTLFWHGHFTSKGNGMDGSLMLRQNKLFRTHALGNFRTLAQAVSRDPEMLRYLNGNENRKAHPNENYGRELMELFTCGIGNYTEDDVKAAARAFSGWNLRAQEFYFNAGQHDNDPKTFLGKTGNWNGDDIVDVLVAHPATARRLCTQLWTYFAYPNPEPVVINALVKTYYDTGYDVRAVLGRILRSEGFYSQKARYAVIKSPAQYVVGSVRLLGLTGLVAPPPASITPAADMAGAASVGAGRGAGLRGAGVGALAGLPVAMRSMGQDILEPPTVKGWDGGPQWINSATMQARLTFASTLSQARQAFDGQFVRAADFADAQGLTSSAAWVDYLAHALGPLPLPPAVRQTLIDYVDGTGDDNAAPAVVQPAAQGLGGAARLRAGIRRRPLPVPPRSPPARSYPAFDGDARIPGLLNLAPHWNRTRH